MIEVRTFVDIALPRGRNRFAEEDIRNMIVDKKGNVDFGILLPMPPEVAKDDDGDFHFDFLPSVGPEWRYANWGCDWNGENARFDEEAVDFVFSVDTTYKPPVGWLKALCAKISDKFPGAYIKGIWVPNKFGDPTFGEFTCEDGNFTDTFEIDWDEPLMVKNLWELDDDDIIAFRGFVKDESVPEVEEVVEEIEEPLFQQPPVEKQEEPSPLPWIIGETPLEEIKEKVKEFVRAWVSEL